MQSYSWKEVREKTLIPHKALRAAIVKLHYLKLLNSRYLAFKTSKGLAQDVSGPLINISL